MPTVSTLELVNVTVGEEVSIEVLVNDTEDDTFIFNNTLPEESEFVVNEDGNGGIFTWTPTSVEQVDGFM